MRRLRTRDDRPAEEEVSGRKAWHCVHVDAAMTTAMAATRRVRLLLPLVVEMLPMPIVEEGLEGAMLSSASSPDVQIWFEWTIYTSERINSCNRHTISLLSKRYGGQRKRQVRADQIEQMAWKRSSWRKVEPGQVLDRPIRVSRLEHERFESQFGNTKAF